MSQCVEDWRHIVSGGTKSWVLFKHGTCVILMEPEEDISKQAICLLRQWGPLHVGSSSGDFDVIHLSNYPGWVVTGHHPDVLNYVSPAEVAVGSDDVMIGVLGRSKRNQDALELQVIHVEDRR